MLLQTQSPNNAPTPSTPSNSNGATPSAATASGNAVVQNEANSIINKIKAELPQKKQIKKAAAIFSKIKKTIWKKEKKKKEKKAITKKTKKKKQQKNKTKNKTKNNKTKQNKKINRFPTLTIICIFIKQTKK